ncbi:MAG: transposase [Nannocystaceae bacterium]
MIPRVPVRHWVLGVPPNWRAALSADATLCRKLTRAFIDSVSSEVTAQSGVQPDEPTRCGAAAVVHRFGSRLDLNVHVHALVLDGVYRRSCESELAVFIPAEPPTGAHLRRIAARVRCSTQKWLRDVDLSAQPPRPLGRALVRQRPARGPIVTPTSRAHAADVPPTRAEVVHAAGMHVHASPPVAPEARSDILALCRYLQRPAVDPTRLHRTKNGNFVYKLLRPFHDGTVAVEFSPDDFASALRRIVTPRNAPRVSFYGALAPKAAKRWLGSAEQLQLLPLGNTNGAPLSPPVLHEAPTRRETARRLPVACPDCGGTMRITDVHEPACDDEGRRPSGRITNTVASTDMARGAK